jgi:hypothetical protein
MNYGAIFIMSNIPILSHFQFLNMENSAPSGVLTATDDRLVDKLGRFAIACIAIVSTIAFEALAIYKYQSTKDICGSLVFTNYSSAPCIEMNNAALTMGAIPAILAAAATWSLCTGYCNLDIFCEDRTRRDLGAWDVRV